MIKIKNLSKKFDLSGQQIHAVENVSLQVDKGQIFGIIGLSGAGKSTLIRCINRLEEPDSGEIWVDGAEITAMDRKTLLEARRHIGMIFQHFNLLHQQTVFDNIAFPLELEKRSKSQIKSRVMELLDYVELLDKKDAYPSQLSGGQKQRVAIARALANHPHLLLSDEGTSALDPKTTQSILALLGRIRKEMNLTILMITHQMEVVKEICDRAAIMEQGRIVEENTVEELFRRPQTKAAQQLIHSLGENLDEEIIRNGNFRGRVIRLSYVGDSAREPLLSSAIKKYPVDINLLSGNLSQLQSTQAGHLVLELLGEDADIDTMLDFLQSKGVYWEVI